MDEPMDLDTTTGGSQIINIATPRRSVKKNPLDLATPSHNAILNEELSLAHDKPSRKSLKPSTPRIKKNVNRSARLKSLQTLVERTVLGNISDDNEDDEELAEHIYGLHEQNYPLDHGNGVAEACGSLEISKDSEIGKFSKNLGKSYTSTQDLSAHENYFYSNRVSCPKTSNTPLSSLMFLDHEEYFSRSRNLKDLDDDMRALELVHLNKFNQWLFELTQDFNLCFYGFGSKRSLLMKFADYLYKSHKNNGQAKVIVVNGHVKSLSIRDIFKTLASAITTEILKSASPSDMLDTVFSLLDQDRSLDIFLVIHSIDGHSLSRLANQNILSRLSAHHQVHLVASADHPYFPLLWDSSLRSLYNFLFHDCTTFQPYSIEIDVVEEVHGLLGRSGRRSGGKEGVGFVLKSLPENAKKLFGILIREQLKVTEDYSHTSQEDNKKERESDNEFGIEYRVLYQKAVEEFVCSNEVNFRTLLKE